MRTGPLFDGSASRTVDRYLQEVETDVGDQAVNAVRTQLRRVLKHPTGKYSRRIHAVQRSADVVVTDGGVVYGPWLEGVARRNRSTRFKGYATFRKVTQSLQDKAMTTAERLMHDKYLGRMQ
jgi:hypothetical protein